MNRNEPRASGTPGCLPGSIPVAVIDIGSNSVRLVVYETLSRSLTPIFNEKVLCGLGRAVASTGRLDQNAVEKALAALVRFRTLCDILHAEQVLVMATAAARDAENGEDFVRRAEEICRTEVEVLSGRREAELAAMGVLAGFYRPDGLVGDLGGGSLELIEVKGEALSTGITLPVGGLTLQDASKRSIARAERLVRAAFDKVEQLPTARDRAFYAVGGTWRALARLHLTQKKYPLRVMHAYTIPADEALAFCRKVSEADPGKLDFIDSVSSERRPLLAYGALVLEQIIARFEPRNVVVSALGVREGKLFSLMDDEVRRADPLLQGARELGYLRSRSPEHGYDLIAWTDRLFSTAGIDETDEERRLRHAACHLSDIGWRAHPDYRGEQSLNIIANASFVGIDHPGRAYIAMAIFYRNEGLADEDLSPRIRKLASRRHLERARILGALLRLAFLVSAAMPGVLALCPLSVKDGKLVLDLIGDFAHLDGARLSNRLSKVAKMLDLKAEIRS